jgi:hypothetical protein
MMVPRSQRFLVATLTRPGAGKNSFQSQHELTIGVDFSKRVVDRQGVTLKCDLYDTVCIYLRIPASSSSCQSSRGSAQAGQSDFRSMIRSYYRNALGRSPVACVFRSSQCPQRVLLLRRRVDRVRYHGRFHLRQCGRLDGRNPAELQRTGRRWTGRQQIRPCARRPHQAL